MLKYYQLHFKTFNIHYCITSFIFILCTFTSMLLESLNPNGYFCIHFKKLEIQLKEGFYFSISFYFIFIGISKSICRDNLFTTNIINNKKKSASCQWISSYHLQYMPEGKKTEHERTNPDCTSIFRSFQEKDDSFTWEQSWKKLRKWHSNCREFLVKKKAKK